MADARRITKPLFMSDKWEAFCVHCGWQAQAYDTREQALAKAKGHRCKKQEKCVGDRHGPSCHCNCWTGAPCKTKGRDA